MTNIQSVLNNGVTTKTIQDASYTFAVDNNIQTVVNNSDDYQTSYSYSYDGLNRLVDASGNYATIEGTTANRFHRQYGYAMNGNLLQKKFLNPDSGATMDSWSYSYSNHAATNISSTLDGAGRFNMAYDAVGNMIQQIDGKAKLTKELEYNSYNRISRVLNSKGQEVSSYEYDDQGFRVRKLVSLGNKQEMLYPSKFFGMDVSGKINSINNIYFNGLRVASMAENGYYYYFMADQVDSVHLVIGDNGEELSRMEYLPYGETFVQEGSAEFSPKYNSQELDKESNFYYYNARHYDPQIARFVTADTVIDGIYDTQGWNRYMYVKGRPIIGKDPTGHLSFFEKSTTIKDTDAEGNMQHTVTEEKFAKLESGKDDGTGLRSLAKQVNEHEGVENTKESVQDTMQRIRTLNKDKISNPNKIPIDTALKY